MDLQRKASAQNRGLASEAVPMTSLEATLMAPGARSLDSNRNASVPSMSFYISQTGRAGLRDRLVRVPFEIQKRAQF